MDFSSSDLGITLGEAAATIVNSIIMGIVDRVHGSNTARRRSEIAIYFCHEWFSADQ
jgi:hypothetical protein